MSSSKKKSDYTVAKFLHWVAVVVIAFNLLSGWKIGEFPLAQKQVLIMVHSGIGTAIFFLMLLRWWWRKSRALYSPPRWWKRPSLLLQWIFYPLLLIQPVIGMVQAAFIDYEVLAFGFIPYSAIAAADESLHRLFFQLHGLTAVLLILLVLAHGLERSKSLFTDEG